MEKAIKKAIEGGYKDYTETSGSSCQKYHSDILLDPKFWQALGKAEGWYQYSEEKYQKGEQTEREALIEVEEKLGVILKYANDEITYSPYKGEGETWQEHWHAFIDHLIAEKPIEDFFTNILTN